MRLPFAGKDEWRWRWMQVLAAKGKAADALHRVRRFAAKDEEHGAGVTGAETACGLSPGRMTMPGLFSRMGAPRCPACCDALGLPRGDGAPFNSKDRAVKDEPEDAPAPLTGRRRGGSLPKYSAAQGPRGAARQGREDRVRRRTGPKAPKYPKPDDGDVQFRNFSGKVMAIVMARNLVDVEVPGPARAGIGILLERPEDLLIDRGALVAWIADGPDAPAVAIETFTNGQLHGGHMDGSTPRREFMAHLDARAPEIHKEARWWAGRRRKKLLARVAERAEAAMAEAKPKRRGKKP